MKKEINVSEIWYGIGIELLMGLLYPNILNFLHQRYDKEELEGLNVTKIYKDKNNIIFDTSDNKFSIKVEASYLPIKNTMEYFSSSERLLTWTFKFIDRIVNNHKIISQIKNESSILNHKSRLKSLQKLTDINLELVKPHYHSFIDIIQLFWLVPEINQNLKFETYSYESSDGKDFEFEITPKISDLPVFYYDPDLIINTPNYILNNKKIKPEIANLLNIQKSIHSSFLNKLTSNPDGLPIPLLTDEISNKILLLLNSTFPHCIIDPKFRKLTLSELYEQSWFFREEDVSIVFSLHPSLKSVLESEIGKESLETVYKKSIHNIKWMKETTLNDLFEYYSNLNIKKEKDKGRYVGYVQK